MQRKCGFKNSLMMMTLLTIAVVQVDAKAHETRGAQLWSDHCARCHNPRPPSEYRDQKWQVIMQHMRIQAGLSGEEAREILTFIVPEYATYKRTHVIDKPIVPPKKENKKTSHKKQKTKKSSQ